MGSCQILRGLMSAYDMLYIWNHIFCEVLSIFDTKHCLYLKCV